MSTYEKPRSPAVERKEVPRTERASHKKATYPKNPNSRKTARGRAPWWLHPRNALLFLSVPLLIVAYLVPESTYFTLYRSEKHVDLNFVLLALIVYAGFIVGSSFAISTSARSQWGEVISYCRWVIWPLFGVTVFGYLIWYSRAMVEAGGVGALFSAFNDLLFEPELGTAEYVKFELFATTPGITTLTQCGILYATVEAFLWTQKASPRRLCLARSAVFASLVLPRTVLLSERLALIEVLIPVVVIVGAWLYSRGVHKNLVRFAPLILGAAVFGLFALGEYFRSWSFYRAIYSGAYPEFAADRFLGYYTTAINNAAVTYYYEPLQPLRYTLTSVLNFPIAGESLTELYAATFSGAYMNNLLLLDVYANAEFNNVALVGQWLNEYTVFLAPVVAFLFGLLATSLYNSFLKGRLLGVLLYPSWFIGILEVSRIYFWSNQRYFPTVAFLLISLVLFRLFKMPSRKPLAGHERA